MHEDLKALDQLDHLISNTSGYEGYRDFLAPMRATFNREGHLSSRQRDVLGRLISIVGDAYRMDQESSMGGLM